MSADDTAHAVVLDFLAHGRSDDDRPGYQREPVCYLLGEDDLQLYEMVFEAPPDVSIGDSMQIEPTPALDGVVARNAVSYDDVSSGAKAEIEYVIEELLDEHEAFYVDFYNRAQPISLRLHQLNLLPGIGEKLRDTILDERKRQPFDSFDDLEARVSGLHDPRRVLRERINEELRDPDLKYHLFVGPDALWARA